MLKDQFKILDDQPVDQSTLFQFKEYSEILAKAIVYAKTPITLGVFGEWGTGKTSLMRMVKKRIDSQDSNKTFTVWFDAWRYENEPNVVVPMLYTIRDELLASKQDTSDEFLQFLGKFLLALGKGLEVGISSGILTASYKPKETIAAYEEFKKENTFGEAVYYDMFRYLRDAINKWGINLIIFVDDLDRCNSEKALATLEAIQLFFNMEGIAVVVGASNITLENAINQKYTNLGIDGRSFLKKIFPASFTIPPVQIDQVHAYIDKLLNSVYSTTEEKEKLSNYFAFGASANPREIKRLINAYVLTRELYHKYTGSNMEISKTALFVVIQQEWPRVFRDISTHKEEFIQFCLWFNEHRNEPNLVAPDWAASMLSIDSEIIHFLKLTNTDLKFNLKDVDIYIHTLSIVALQSLLPTQVSFIHTANIMETGDYKWSIRPDTTSRVFEKIEQIEYRLPTNIYAQNKRITTKEDGFCLEEEAHENVPIEVEIFVKFKEISESESFSYVITF